MEPRSRLYGLGRVDSMDSRLVRDVIQDCFWGGGGLGCFRSAGFGRWAMGADRAAHYLAMSARVGRLGGIILCLSRMCCESCGPVRRGGDLPEIFGAWNSAFRRFSRWSAKGVWHRMFAAWSDDPDFEYLIVDASIVRDHQHAAGAKRRLKIKPLAACWRPASGVMATDG